MLHNQLWIFFFLCSVPWSLETKDNPFYKVDLNIPVLSLYLGWELKEPLEPLTLFLRIVYKEPNPKESMWSAMLFSSVAHGLCYWGPSPPLSHLPTKILGSYCLPQWLEIRKAQWHETRSLCPRCNYSKTHDRFDRGRLLVIIGQIYWRNPRSSVCIGAGLCS